MLRPLKSIHCPCDVKNPSDKKDAKDCKNNKDKKNSKNKNNKKKQNKSFEPVVENEIITSCSVYQSPIALSTTEKQMFLSTGIFKAPKQTVKNYEFDPKEKIWVVNPENKVILFNNGETYRLVEFHFHQPAEHVVNGKTYPIELHLVFSTEEENVFVLGILAKEAKKTSSLLKKIINGAPFKVPQIETYWAYPGSLTTPPAVESLTWNVYGRLLKITAEDLEELKEMSKAARPIQSREGRDIVFATPCQNKN